MEKFKNEYIENYFSEFTSRIVSETGIPSDKYHLGKIILQSLKDDPDLVLQIDAATGESETNGSVLKRSIRCATSFRNMGMKTGDVIALLAPHHLDQAIPLYAALYLGIATAAIDRALGVNDLKDTFDICKPKIIFCQSEKVQDIREAVDLSGLAATVISFDKSPDAMSFHEMMEKYDDDINVKDFKPADFDPVETIANLLMTSGTTGPSKAAIVTHKNFAHGALYICDFATKLPAIRSTLILSSLQWVSSIIHYIMSPYYKYTRVQSSQPFTTDHFLETMQKYKPTYMMASPMMMTSLLKAGKINNGELSSLQVMRVGGCVVPKKLLEELRSLLPNTLVVDVIGMSEAGSSTFHNARDVPIGSFGKPFAHIQYKLVNTVTGDEVTEPNEQGELWIKTPGGVKGYYNNPEATAKALTKDGWLKSGDLMYRDEEWNFYFVERVNQMLTYENHQISPSELERVISQHPGVSEVVVSSYPNWELGDLPVACVIPHPGAEVTAEEIQNLVKDNLADYKQLRGGVIFLKELPLTASSKVNRRKLKEIVLSELTI